MKRLFQYYKSEIEIPKSEIKKLFLNQAIAGNGIFNFGFQLFL